MAPQVRILAALAEVWGSVPSTKWQLMATGLRSSRAFKYRLLTPGDIGMFVVHRRTCRQILRLFKKKDNETKTKISQEKKPTECKKRCLLSFSLLFLRQGFTTHTRLASDSEILPSATAGPGLKAWATTRRFIFSV